MKDTKVSVVARRMMAEERDRIARRKRKQISPVEQSAIAWLKEEEEKKRREREKEWSLREQQQPTISFQAMTEKLIEEQRQKKEDKQEKVGWKQFHPWQGEQDEQATRKPNSASIALFARKMMAREWARALGKPTNPGPKPLELSAQKWEERGKTKERERILRKQMSLLADETKTQEEKLALLEAIRQERKQKLAVQANWAQKGRNWTASRDWTMKKQKGGFKL
ncbi:hypothetical protein L6258_02970 [Candidatus Parcubacteria bacterium]|nr:hypothetical protein [Candidatus Parcubacteria bacterium]